MNKNGNSYLDKKNSNQPMNININPDDCEEIVCSECKNNNFKLGVRLKLIPSIIVGKEKQILTQQVFLCTVCDKEVVI